MKTAASLSNEVGVRAACNALDIPRAGSIDGGIRRRGQLVLQNLACGWRPSLCHAIVGRQPLSIGNPCFQALYCTLSLCYW